MSENTTLNINKLPFSSVFNGIVNVVNSLLHLKCKEHVVQSFEVSS